MNCLTLLAGRGWHRVQHQSSPKCCVGVLLAPLPATTLLRGSGRIMIEDARVRHERLTISNGPLTLRIKKSVKQLAPKTDSGFPRELSHSASNPASPQRAVRKSFAS